MSAGAFDRFSPRKGGGSGDGMAQKTPDKTPPSGASTQGLTSSPQPLKIVKDVLGSLPCDVFNCEINNNNVEFM